MKWYSPIFIILVAFVIVLLVGLEFYEGNLDFLKPTSQTIGQITSMPTIADTFVSVTTPFPMSTFNHSPILGKFTFVDSNGRNKVLIIVKTGEGYPGIPMVDTYITDENLSKTSAVKIPVLSGKDSPLGYPLSYPAGLKRLVISASPSMGEKLIVFDYDDDVGAFMIFLDENGQQVLQDVEDKILTLMHGKCRCAWHFGEWHKENQFYVFVLTAAGEPYAYRVLVDGATGELLSAPEAFPEYWETYDQTNESS